MKTTTTARLTLLVLLAAGFFVAGWQLMLSAPQSKRERPAAPIPLVDVIDSTPRDHRLTLNAAGPVTSAYQLEIRPQVEGRIAALHADFEPGGRIPAGATLLQIEPDDYRLAVDAAEAEIAKARAAIALEQGRRVVAREELETLKGSVAVDAASAALALRKPQLRQVQAELAAAENRLAQARLELERAQLQLPFDVIVLERSRVAGEVVAARELVGRVTRADRYWVELRVRPAMLRRLTARDRHRPGSRVLVRTDDGVFEGEVIRIRADLATESRLAGVIVAIPVDARVTRQLLLGSYVQAEIAAGEIGQAIAVPRRAVHDNDRLWVVDAEDVLRVREARIEWESGQRLLLHRESLRAGDRIVVSRTLGLVPGAGVRSRVVELDPGHALAMQPAAPSRATPGD